MRRRRVLALGTAASLSGCLGIATNETRTTPTGATERASTATSTAIQGGVTPSIGVSLNGRPYRLGENLGMVETCETRWLHAFLDVREKHDRDVIPEEDPDITPLRRASRDLGTKLVVSLQWDFIGLFGDKGPERVPPPGSDRERALFEHATEMLEAIGQPVEIVVLGNEPIWESLDEDVRGDDPAVMPFTRNLKAHLLEHYTAGDPRYLVGAFNRLYNDTVWEKYERFYRQLFEMARTDDDIDGIDLHVHYDVLSYAETMLDKAREAFPDGTMTVTEFSPIWRYSFNKDEPIAGFEGGDRFAERYGISERTTVVEYLQAAKEDRLSHGEMADFMAAMPWYNVNFVEDMYRLLETYGVEVGTFGFLVGRETRHVDWTEQWAPFEINRLFQPGLIDTDDGAHPHYLDDFRDRA